MTTPADPVIRQQIEYYRQRAPEYDEWFLRLGRYDRGPESNRQWFDAVEIVRRSLDVFAPAGHVLELAPGTGLWTERLLPHARRITAVDASPEMIALNRSRLRSDRVEYIQADLFAWQPQQTYDTVFFSFWLSHVPPEHFEAFWGMVRSCLAKTSRVFFVDSLYQPDMTARDHRLGEPEETTTVRRLNDGRAFEIVKVFYDPPALQQRLTNLGWKITVSSAGECFLFGKSSV